MTYIFVGVWAVILVIASFRFLGDRAGYGSLITAAVVAFLIYKDYKDKKAAREAKEKKDGKKIITAGSKKNAPTDISSVAHMSTKGKNPDK
jgi:uncharacterized membrane protein YebE (DUF533 family)